MPEKIIGFASGTIARCYDNNRADIIKIIRKLKGIKGVELTYGPRIKPGYTLSKKDAGWLKKVEYVSIHSPFKFVRISNEKEIEKGYKEMFELYKKVNAKAMIVHPKEIPSKKILKKFRMNYLTENMPNNGKQTRLSFEKILKENKTFGLCLDTAHAYGWGISETGRIVKKWKNRIKEVHLSSRYKRKDHRSLQLASNDFLKSIEPLKELNCPIVIEEDIFFNLKKHKISRIQKEIDLIKNQII